MSQVQITGKYVNAAQIFSTGSFTKQTIIVEVVNGNYTSYFAIEFHQADVQNVFPQIQPHGVYTFTCWVQGSNQQMTDKNGQPTAYTQLKCTAVVPAQNASAPAPAQNNFQQPQQPAQGFAQPQQQGGFAGQPQPQQQSFGQQPAQPAQSFGAPAQQQAPAAPFGQPAPSAGQGFGQNQAQPQPAAAQPFGAPAANNGNAFGNL